MNPHPREVETFQDWTERHYREKLAEVVDRVRAIADEMEREGGRLTNAVSAPRFAWAANRVLHAAGWGMANADLGGLLLTAAMADREDAKANPTHD